MVRNPHPQTSGTSQSTDVSFCGATEYRVELQVLELKVARSAQCCVLYDAETVQIGATTTLTNAADGQIIEN